MDAFPAFFPLAGRRVVIAGTGEAADAKARLFDGSPARVERLESDAALRPDAYRDAALAFVASPDDAFAGAACAAARAAGVPVNVVDRPHLCDFTTPAIIDRGEVVAAIGTGGASPMLATMLRHDIEARVPEGVGRIAALFRTLQDEVRAALPDLARRRTFLRSALTGPAARAALAGETEQAAALLRESLASGAEARGIVQFLDGRGPAELLSLRASRALAAADVLVLARDLDPDVLALARRDAERLDKAGPDRLAGLAAGGLRVLKFNARPAEVRAMADHGVDFEVLPTAG